MPDSTRIIPLGGLGEVGKNMTVFEADGEAIVVDATEPELDAVRSCLGRLRLLEPARA